MTDFTIGGPIFYAGLLLSSIWVIRKLIFGPKKLPLPPGPKGLPIIGNIFDLPPPGTAEWKHWAKFKDIYGPIISVNVLGKTIIVIHDKKMASELLEKRSAKFSSRPEMFFAAEMCGHKTSMSFQPYNDRFKLERKLAAKQLGTKQSIVKFYSTIELQVMRFLLRGMNDNTNLTHSLQAEAGSVILDMIYGYQTNPDGRDPLVVLVNQMMADFGEATVAGAWLVDVVPWIRFLPNWFPGTEFKRTARRYKKTLADATNIPFEFTKQQTAQGSKKPSYVAGNLEGANETEVDATKHSAMNLYGGGADTTVASLAFFFLAMSIFPEVQKKAQEELDRVVGTGRLPSFQDRANLPYLDAVLKETVRWLPIASLGLPHTTDEEDEFRGYRIPKGAIIMPSIGWISQDPNNYPEPEKFMPERFLGPIANQQLDPGSYAFGFGRRVCPGRHLAEANMWLMIAQNMAVFDITKQLGPDGKEIEPMVGQAPGIVAHPIPFQCKIAPRSEKHREIIINTNLEHPIEEGDSKYLPETLTA
ncbi:hypothetical protein ABW20_dc0107053 [Dactylellina cionopaga]|nr:hypothetical protein ABW20_dc0107053 [Dactylellina cionopaga]